MTQSTKNDLHGMLIIRLSDTDSADQNIESQIRHKLGFVVDTANITGLLIDLEGVSFLPSVAIGQLIMLKRKCDQKQIALGLCCISEQNMKALRLVRFEEIMDVFNDQASAVESLRETQPVAPRELLSEEEVAKLVSLSESGDVDARFDLAQRKANGDGLKQDPVDAMQWYLLAAQQDHRDAQYELATCYAFGLGVEQDYALAVPWYEKSAEQGHANAQYMLGMSYQYSLNDVKDPRLAREWYEHAAAQGHEKARLALAEMAS